MSLRFTKMHGLGNDFMVIDAIRQSVSLEPEIIAGLARRDTGVGFDQCLIIEASRDKSHDFFYRIFNADGREVGQCGNGARCLMRYLHRYQLSDKTEVTVATHTTSLRLGLMPNSLVVVELGLPNFSPAEIPLNVTHQAPQYYLPMKDGTTQMVAAVSVGNPHAVSLVSGLKGLGLETTGKAISTHPFFPEECNAGFMEIIHSSCVHLRVFERGVGETLACGSGAVAAVAVGRRYHQLAPTVEVVLPGGSLWVDWPDMEQPISLTGPAEFVYEGVLCKL